MSKEFKIRKNASIWKLKIGESMNVKGGVCSTCKYQSCPKSLAAYILYLKNKGILKENLIARKKL